METGLQGKVALVTASSTGLGKAVAMELAREGANIVMCARRPDILEASAGEIRQATAAEVLAIPADLSTEDGPRTAVAAATDRFGRLDILVNNAGGPPPGDFTRHSDTHWQQAFELNLLSAVRLVREALPYLQQSGSGRIINLTSVAVKQPVEALILSNSIRAGVIGMAKTLSVELAPYGITVNNIAPGRIDTTRIRQLDQHRAQSLGITEEEARAAFIEQIPLGRYGNPEELAYLAVFLASDKASYITGTTIQVDGGMTRSLL